MDRVTRRGLFGRVAMLVAAGALAKPAPAQATPIQTPIIPSGMMAAFPPDAPIPAGWERYTGFSGLSVSGSARITNEPVFATKIATCGLTHARLYDPGRDEAVVPLPPDWRPRDGRTAL